MAAPGPARGRGGVRGRAVARSRRRSGPPPPGTFHVGRPVRRRIGTISLSDLRASVTGPPAAPPADRVNRTARNGAAA